MKIKDILDEYFKVTKSGVVSLANWTMFPDGEKYLYAYCESWTIMTDKMVSVPGFRSSEHWQLVALSKRSEVLAVFPGCQVKAFVSCNNRPMNNDVGWLA